MNQYVHLISNSFMDLPTDSWMPVTNKLKPLVSDQISWVVITIGISYWIFLLKVIING